VVVEQRPLPTSCGRCHYIVSVVAWQIHIDR